MLILQSYGKMVSKFADKNIFKNLSPTIRLSNKDIKQC